MGINIKLMSEVAYLTLQKNPLDVYHGILNHSEDGSWIKEYLGFEPYEEKEYRIEDFQLQDKKNNNEAMLDNSIILYEHLKDLPR